MAAGSAGSSWRPLELMSTCADASHIAQGGETAGADDMIPPAWRGPRARPGYFPYRIALLLLRAASLLRLMHARAGGRMRPLLVSAFFCTRIFRPLRCVRSSSPSRPSSPSLWVRRISPRLSLRSPLRTVIVMSDLSMRRGTETALRPYRPSSVSLTRSLTASAPSPQRDPCA